jgi:hypothetical protein
MSHFLLLEWVFMEILVFNSLGPIPWAVNSEIYPQNVRGLAVENALFKYLILQNGIATTANWSCECFEVIVNFTANLLISVTFLSYINLVGSPFAFWTYGGFGIIAWIIFFFALPETKGKSIEEIQHMFIKKK